MSVDPWGCYIGQKRRDRRFPWGGGTYKMAVLPGFLESLPTTSVYYIRHPLFALRSFPSCSCPQPKVAAKSWEVVTMVVVTPWHPPHREQAMFYRISQSPLLLCGCLHWVTLASVLSSWCCIQFLQGLPRSPSTNYARVCSLPFSFFLSFFPLWPHITLGWEEPDIRRTSYVETHHVLLPDSGQ